jgi:hypothetical protein
MYVARQSLFLRLLINLSQPLGLDLLVALDNLGAQIMALP